MNRSVRGFTLIELMIAVAVVAILAVIAYPSYQQYFVRATRSATQSFMLDVANKQEQYLLDARTYLGVANHAGFSGLGLSVPDEVARFYTVTVTGATATAYTIQAVPIAGTRQAADGTLTLDQSGVRTPADKWKK